MIASFISSTEDNIKTYSILINILLVWPDYALAHALNVLLQIFVKQREPNYNFNFGKKQNLLTQNISEINVAFRFVFADHQYATAEPETVTYTHISDPLDLTKYFIYMGSVILIIYVSYF